MTPFRKTSRIIVTALAIMHATAYSRTARREEVRLRIAAETPEKLLPLPSPKATVRRWLVALSLLAGLLTCVPTASANGLGADSWQEEVLLHDGRTIVAERSVRRGGRAEIGQTGAYVEQHLRFTDPATGKTFAWSDVLSPELGMANFLVLALHVVDATPYVVATPMGCQSYNKWGRPNPPYVIFMGEGAGWRRIGLAELPADARTANVLHSAPDEWVRRHATRHVTAAQIQAENATNQPPYRAILREPVSYDPSCIPMVTNGKGLWRAQAWFSEKPNLEACLAGCKRENFDEKTCPCNQFFEGSNK